MNYRTVIVAAAVAGCLATSLPAQTAGEIDDAIYVALRGAVGRATLIGADDLKLRRIESYGATFSLGQRFTPYFRAELEYAWRTKGKRTVTTSVYSANDEWGDFWEDDDWGNWGNEWDLDDEGGGSYSRQRTTIEYSVHSLMVHSYFDIPVGRSPVQPFVSLGLGGTYGKVETSFASSASGGGDDWGDFWGDDWFDSEFDEDSPSRSAGRNGSTSENSTRLSWSAGLGLSCYITDSFAIDAMYRYSDLGKFKTTADDYRTRITMNEILVGARVTF